MVWVLGALALLWLGRSLVGRVLGCLAGGLAVVVVLAVVTLLASSAWGQSVGFCLDNRGEFTIPAGATYIEMPGYRLIECRPESGTPGGWVDTGVVVAPPTPAPSPSAPSPTPTPAPPPTAAPGATTAPPPVVPPPPAAGESGSTGAETYIIAAALGLAVAALLALAAFRLVPALLYGIAARLSGKSGS